MNYRFLKNSSRDFFDYTMDRILKAVDEDERSNVDSNYIAQIISGDFLGGDTTTPQQNIKYVNLNGKVAMSFKIRFVEKSSKYNFVENPFPLSGSGVEMLEEERKILVSMHDDALLEANGLPTIPKFGDIVVCSRLPGRIFVIEKVLTNNSTLLQVLSGAGGLGGMFGAGGLLGDGGAEGYVGVKGEKDRYSKDGKSVKLNGKIYRPYVRKYIGNNALYKGKDIENGIFIEGLHQKVPAGIMLGGQYIFLKEIVPNFVNLAKAFEQQFGKKIYGIGGFRTWQGQISTRKAWCAKGQCKKAAPPGTSNHGWGLAFDWETSHNGKSSFQSETYKWMFQNAPRYGFWSPKWARPNGSNPEAWHFEFQKPGLLFER